MELLLKDGRIGVEARDLHLAAEEGFLDVVRLILAFRGNINLKWRAKSGDALEEGKTTSEWVKLLDQTPKREWMDFETYRQGKSTWRTIADLLDAYEADTASTRAELMRAPHMKTYFIAHTFALVVFLSDGFVREDCPEVVFVSRCWRFQSSRLFSSIFARLFLLVLCG